MRAITATLLVSIVFAGCSGSSIDVTAPGDPRCSVSVTGATTSFGADGGSGQLNVTTTRDCEWSAAAGADWITLGGPTSGQGDAVVEYSIEDNAEHAGRQGAIEVSGERIQIRQEGAPEAPDPPESPEPPSGPEPPAPTPPGPEPPTPGPEPPDDGGDHPEPPGNGDDPAPPGNGDDPAPPGDGDDPEPPACDYAIEPTSRDVTAVGGLVTVAVTTSAGCAWTATSREDWITVVDGSSGSGQGTVTLAVQVNGGSARTGSVEVANRRLTVRQEAALEEPPEPEPPPDPEPPPEPEPPECPYELSPTTYTAGLLGGPGTVNVITADGCRWRAKSDASWITIVSESKGTGTGVITFRVDPYVGLVERTGTLTIADRTFTVRQGLL